MPKRRDIFAFLILALAACAASNHDWRSLTLLERRTALEAISKKCAFPSDRMQIGTENQLHFRPHAGDPYEAVDCALAELKHFNGIDMGFVGNEAYPNGSR